MTSSSRLTHLRRLTDPRGLLKAALGECPDRSAGYDTMDNIEALRLCALGSETVDADVVQPLAKIYFGFLTRARLDDGRVQHACDPLGNWRETTNDTVLQSCLARGLAAVIVSELPIQMRLAAAEWWSSLLPHADHARVPVAAANWLLAFGQLRTADPGRDLARAAKLANWLLEDCYYAIQSTGWEWFESRWTARGACIPAALWQANLMLGDKRFAGVAERTTQFVIDHVFSDECFAPVGTRGSWHRQTTKPMFDQFPAETCSVVEFLHIVQQATSDLTYGQLAADAARWFTGNNLHGVSLIDAQSGGCYDALKSEGVDRDQGAGASLAYLLSHAILNTAQPISADANPYCIPISG